MLMNVLLEELPALGLGSVSTLSGVTSASVTQASTSCTSEANTNVTVISPIIAFCCFFLRSRKASQLCWCRGCGAGRVLASNKQKSSSTTSSSRCTGTLFLLFICQFYMDTHMAKKNFCVWNRMYIFMPSYLSTGPCWCGSVDWAPAHEPMGCRFDSQSGHMPGLWVRSPIGGVVEKF